MAWLASPRTLKKQGVLGMNHRNGAYVQLLNRRRSYPKADNKIITKNLALEAGIAVPELYTTFSSTGELRDLESRIADFSDFVVKPARGSGGNGVLVLQNRDGALTKLDDTPFHIESLKTHIANTLHGLYSLGGKPDEAMVEYRVRFSKIFTRITYQGVPDFRIIVFQGVPVLAMMRLPTKKSQGRANLHQGAIGVGLSIADGETSHAIWNGSSITHHPDTGGELQGIEIPYWERLLRIAMSCADMTGLGYLGADLVLDEDRGPLLLELNVRPGLAVQLANQKGLRAILERVASHNPRSLDFEERLRLSKTAS